ncbi:GntR family transcriptional regulator [Hoeflea sp.]|uniref:GntR family transcriptional regulator n=1 Tax=Hoeflea sp. TaxID=1940281 RepID=UPI003B515593
MVKPVATTSLQDLVYVQLSEALMEGAFRPGEMLNLNDLAQSFGTSLMPVRDAVRRLATEEALDVEPQKGARVRVHTASEFAEMTELRAHLEGDLTRCAVQQMGDDARADVLAHMNRLLIGDHQPAEFLRLNRDFYFALYKEASRPVTLRLVRSLWQQVGPVITLYLPTDNANGSEALQRLKDFGAALISGDAARANALRQDQINLPSQRLLAQYDLVMSAVAPAKSTAPIQSLNGTVPKRRPGRPRRNT